MVEVLDKAAALFASRGFASTSLQDIAKEVGLSRTSIYYYVPSKEALLEELVRGVNERTAKLFADLNGLAGSHADRVGEAARQLVLWVTDPHTHFKLLDRTEGNLPEALAAAHRATKRDVLQGMVGLVQKGIAGGEFRPVNPQVAAFAILGMCNWTAWWVSPAGSLSRKDIAGQIAGMAIATVCKAPGSGSVQDACSLTAAIRENLDLLDLLHTEPAATGGKRVRPARSSPPA